jgi:uncharacterized protein (DUF488 family)
MEILSAGTSGTTAEQFFSRLKLAGATSVIDTRLHRSSQLAAFAKEKDLRYFLDAILGIDYFVTPLLAPEVDALRDYRSKRVSWAEYESQYAALIEGRRVSERLDPRPWGDRPVLLCSEHLPDHCHRRLAANYLAEKWEVDGIRHLA